MPAEWGSDVIVDMMKAYGIKYAPLNLGGTYRGLLDSMLNYGGNETPVAIECLHEEIAVGVAHGYSKASGEPSVALVHNVVGTLHASMAIYETFVSKTPVIVMSGTGPMSIPERRPWIDWVHTALVQGNLVRDYVKWDDQPHDPASFPESFMRAYRVAMTEPRGPVYIALDAGWQEAQLQQPIPIPDVSKFAAPAPVQGDPGALRRAARLLAEAEFPIILADRVGRNPGAVASLIELAEAATIPVVDVGGAFNFPNTHPLDATGTDLIGLADVVLLLDVEQPEVVLVSRDRYPRGPSPSRLKAGATVVSIGLSDLAIRSTMTDYGRLYPVSLSIAADTSLAIPQLTEELRSLGATKPSAGADKRRATIGERKTSAQRRWADEADREAGHRPISHARLAQETWSHLKGDPWVLQGSPEGWARRLWEIDRPGSVISAGGAAGLGTGLSRAIGVGLAARDRGGYCVAFNGDGDFFYDPSCLWTAVHHHIPVLAFVLDNGGYIGEGGHVTYINQQRERSTANKHIAVEIREPRIDIAGYARAQGAYAEGPIEDPSELGPAIARALKVVKEESTLALLAVRVP
ncbi:MAG TPA: thiamine pyrophosphate-dependent enzyme [Chloroflexota bacterium]|nr:thiamine pyrophosphate-dependent enzyme [Chloroflexota bacterium]